MPSAMGMAVREAGGCWTSRSCTWASRCWCRIWRAGAESGPPDCKGRGVCPSCNAKRAHVTAAHLVERVLPHVPYRQWTLSQACPAAPGSGSSPLYIQLLGHVLIPQALRSHCTYSLHHCVRRAQFLPLLHLDAAGTLGDIHRRERDGLHHQPQHRLLVCNPSRGGTPDRGQILRQFTDAPPLRKYSQRRGRRIERLLKASGLS
jgi:hypothetical protein